MPKKVLIATGGTGGHIYPAVAIAQQFSKEGAKVLFIGGGLSQNRYFDKAIFDFRSVSCGAFRERSPLAVFKSFKNMMKGIWQSCAIIRDFQPDVVVGFGSYYSFPPLIAAKMKSIPIVLHEANSIPGKVNRLLSPYVYATGVHFPQTLGLVKGKRFEVGMPLREGFKKGNISHADAKKYFDLPPEGHVLLVFGGSQGARMINFHVLEALKLLPERAGIQVIHLAGDAEQVAALQEGYRKLRISSSVKSFEGRMEMAWQAADLVISRSGASSIAEQLEFEVPGILIPFPRATEDHQNHNADFLANTVRGARKIEEKELNAHSLAIAIDQLLSHHGAGLDKMRQAMRDYKKAIRTRDLYSLINEVIKV